MRLSYFIMPVMAALILFLALFIEPAYIGYIISQGGNVTRVDLNQANYYWQGIYGNISGSSENITLIGNVSDVHLLHVNIQNCPNIDIYASTANIDFTNLVPAVPGDVDTYLGLAASNRFSGTRVFTNTSSFDVYNNTFTLNSTVLNSVTGTYEMGILKDGATLIFVTKPDNGIGFTGTPTDYQMMLPVPVDQNTTYQFSMDPMDLAACNLTGVPTLTASLADDNVSILLRWPQEFADNYTVYSTENISQGFSLLAEGINILNYTDYSANVSTQKLYRVSYWNASSEEYFNKTVGKYDIEINFANGNPATYELNQISYPLIPNNLTFENLMMKSSDGDIVLRFNTTDIGGRFAGWETNIRIGNVWLKQFERYYVEEGYVFVSVTNPYNLTIVGETAEGMLGVPMVPITGTPGNYEMMLLGWNTLRTDCDLNLALNTTTPPGALTWFDTTDVGGQYAGWETYLLINNGTWNWFPTNDCLRPTHGYRFLSNGVARTWNYNRSAT